MYTDYEPGVVHLRRHGICHDKLATLGIIELGIIVIRACSLILLLVSELVIAEL